MYKILSDLRLVGLAMFLEQTLENYEQSLRDTISRAPVRAKLHAIFDPGPSHEELRGVHRDLARRVEGLKTTVDEEDALQAILECEKIAHEFYLRSLDHLADPGLVQLFRRLAVEELSHIKMVESSIEMMRSFPKAVREASP